MYSSVLRGERAQLGADALARVLHALLDLVGGEQLPRRELLAVAPQRAVAELDDLAVVHASPSPRARPRRAAERRAATTRSGPPFGYRPEIDWSAFTIAATPAASRLSAATRSRSRWSMTAMSPLPIRVARSFVRGPTRATPTTCGRRPPARAAARSSLIAPASRPAPRAGARPTGRRARARAGGRARIRRRRRASARSR